MLEMVKQYKQLTQKRREKRNTRIQKYIDRLQLEFLLFNLGKCQELIMEKKKVFMGEGFQKMRFFIEIVYVRSGVGEVIIYEELWL